MNHKTFYVCIFTLYQCYSFRFHFIWFHIYFLHVLFLFLFLFLFMFMPSIHVVGWCPVFAKLSMQILDNNNYNRNENTKHMLRGYVWASGLIRTQNILLMWHRNWPVIIQWKCNQCMCVRARVCLIHMLYAPPSHTPVPCLASHCIETDKSVCIIHSRSSTKENAHCNGHTDDQNTKEEEVYHDLCAIHRATRSQVLFFCCTPFYFFI